MRPCTSRRLTPSIIRQAMVKLMQQHNMQQSALSPFGVRGEGGLKSPAVMKCSPNSRSKDQGAPSMCIMWCAIGLGALVQGAPVEKVSTHCDCSRRTTVSSGGFCSRVFNWRACDFKIWRQMLFPSSLRCENDRYSVEVLSQ